MRDPCARWRERLPCDGIVGRSEALARVLAEVHDASLSDLPVLLLGPTGAGKTAFARLIHEASERRGGPFVQVPCHGFPETLFESTMFGAERGAYTGADRPQVGYVQRAERGTLFLDEIGELPAIVQSKLLVFLQERRYAPLGSTRERRADLRVIAATNASPDHLRPDLYHRLAGFVIQLPSLAERVEDVPLIAEAVVRRHAAERREPPPALGEDAVQVLIATDWKGNVRDLENVVKRAVVRVRAEGGDRIEARHVAPVRPPDPPGSPRLADRVRAYELWLVERALAECGGRVADAAARLGVSRSWLYALRAGPLRRPAA